MASFLVVVSRTLRAVTIASAYHVLFSYYCMHRTISWWSQRILGVLFIIEAEHRDQAEQNEKKSL